MLDDKDLADLGRLAHKLPRLREALSPRDARTVRELAGVYFADPAFLDLAPRSRVMVEDVLCRFLAAFGDRPAADLTPADLRRWIGGQTGWRSGHTRKRACSTVQKLFNFAVASRLVKDNAVRGASYRSGPNRRAMTTEEFRRLLRAAPAYFRRVLLALAWTGARPGELAGLRWEHVNWQDAVVVLLDHKTARKTGKPRVIVLTDAVVRLLRWLRERQRCLGSPFVFLNCRGLPWNRGSLGGQVQQLRARTGLPADVQLHTIRHRWITAAVEAGLNLKVVATLAGHADVRITESVYCHIDQNLGLLHAAARRVNGHGKEQYP